MKRIHSSISPLQLIDSGIHLTVELQKDVHLIDQIVTGGADGILRKILELNKVAHGESSAGEDCKYPLNQVRPCTQSIGDDFCLNHNIYEELTVNDMKLKICDPAITSHHFYALPLSIIGSDPKLKPWLYSEFIQIYTCRNREDEK